MNPLTRVRVTSHRDAGRLLWRAACADHWHATFTSLARAADWGRAHVSNYHRRTA